MLLLLVLLLVFKQLINASPDFDPDLPARHLPMFYRQFPNLKPADWNDETEEQCWGYEEDCVSHNTNLTCDEDAFVGWTASRTEAEQLFFNQADFGNIKERRGELQEFCLQGTINQSSSLKCTKHLQFCEGENLMIDLTGIKDRVYTDNLRYRMDVLSEGDMRIHCQFRQKIFEEELQYMSPLQSWAPELRNIRESDEPLSPDNPACDLYLEQPVYIMKLDATVNMYHHFCDFFNLYLSLFIKQSTHGTKMFNTENQIIIWENHNYFSNFGDTWSAFTRNPLWNLKDLAGNRICFRKVVFPLLPRMLFGLFYNTPLITGCRDSALFTAFSEFILHRLKIQTRQTTNKIRITLLSRGTKFRNIINEKELVDSMNFTGRFEVNLARFNHKTPFKHQLEIIRNTDILIGLHGAGLTHLLFLPPWAAVFELYHCEDPECYSDLARLRGLKYTTWQKLDKLTAIEAPESPYSGPAHEKFRNYKFDAVEFLRVLAELEAKVKLDDRYIQNKEEEKDWQKKEHNEGREENLGNERIEERKEALTDRKGEREAFNTKDREGNTNTQKIDHKYDHAEL